MKRILTLCIALCTVAAGMAQTDTTSKNKPDTIRIGGITIVKKGGGKDKQLIPDRDRHKTHSSNSNLTTNWWIIDLGWSNFNDKTNYTSAAAQAYAPGINESWMDLKNGRSRNVNIWFFQQRLNMVKHVVNLKYGLGIELNNYFYKRNLRYNENTIAVPNPPVLSLDNTSDRTYKKDKLAADYLTLPVMLNFNFTPRRSNGFGFSAGMSFGYLYSARNKTITSDEGKKKSKDDFDLEKWKISYVGELSLGPVKLYASYATKSMYSRGLDITPYNFGFRLSNW